jgi:hypothetical protein
MIRKNDQQASVRPQAGRTHGDLDPKGALPHGLAIKEHMEVMASCGTRVGKVDQVEGKWVKLTEHDAQAGGKHHYIPLDWVERIDRQVHLKRDSDEVMREWLHDLPRPLGDSHGH